MIALLATVGAATAQDDAPKVYPQAEPTDISSVFEDFAEKQGRSGKATQVRCRNLAPDLNLCFRVIEEGRLRYVTTAHLEAWDKSLEEVEALAKEAAKPGLGGRLERVIINGVEGGVYWAAKKGDGKDTGALLVPELLEEIAGAEPVVAVPSAETLVMWVPGRKEVDRIMAVGVREIHDASKHAVSTKIYRWDGGRWQVWGEAVKPD